jgi:hypothetical protein
VAVASLDVVVPALRTATIDRLLFGLARGSTRPDVVSLVSNEVPSGIETHGLDVRLLRFRSETYPVGERDVALRRDVGIWSSECSHVLSLDDDLAASAGLVESSLALLRDEPCFWGHHRYIWVDGYGPERLLELPPELGRPRESPPNSWHMWRSCYGGLFGFERSLVQGLGGFDLAFSCRHAGEDQALGKRLAAHLAGTEQVFVHEPPFAWHPADPEPWEPPGWTNLCREGHELEERSVNGLPVRACGRCPYFVAAEEEPLFGDEPVLPFDPALVDVTVEEL